ncbi:hypothetical protein AnigIFM50267_001366 [Aspergillus niger]|uniref:Uncharacterized protein n=1 Tax=Aspergillus welwitschiae TaxID=1341132 RepID=A0A3F3PRZ9_9EURO|nr:hypothetical protein BDQ94DRAFT_173673 [Aspergillus welwitschiae]RDH29664.1 hypothetical protein BDQ94DRAFT_173673 [Aspergillus welwitschiae]GKZ67099.1 hypothetical protein AnigIFM50267_001366 [Aspergillus niger]GLA11010.1 hypothetical protein AnigIFM62618_003297 [Aspergillus niger]
MEAGRKMGSQRHKRLDLSIRADSEDQLGGPGKNKDGTHSSYGDSRESQGPFLRGIEQCLSSLKKQTQRPTTPKEDHADNGPTIAQTALGNPDIVEKILSD